MVFIKKILLLLISIFGLIIVPRADSIVDLNFLYDFVPGKIYDTKFSVYASYESNPEVSVNITDKVKIGTIEWFIYDRAFNSKAKYDYVDENNNVYCSLLNKKYEYNKNDYYAFRLSGIKTDLNFDNAMLMINGLYSTDFMGSLDSNGETYTFFALDTNRIGKGESGEIKKVEPKKDGMSTGTKVLISVGILAIIGLIVGLIIYKNKKKVEN